MKTLNKPTLLLLYLFIVGGLFVSCSKDTEQDLEDSQRPDSKKEYVITLDNITYKLNYSDYTAEITRHSLSIRKELRLPERVANSEGEEFTVVSIADGAFGKCNFITSLDIPSSVSYIGSKAFYNCSNLESVFIHGGQQSIGEDSFSDCKNLRKVEIGDLARSIGDRAFSDCEALNSVYIGHGVKTIGDYAFYGDSNIKTLTLGKSLEYIGYRCFWDNKGMWDTEYVMEHIYCYALTPPKYYNDPNYPVFRAVPDKTFLHVVKGRKNAYMETWIADIIRLTVNRYPRVVDDLTADGGTIPPSGNYFNMDYDVHTQSIGQNSDVILYQDDDYDFQISIRSGMADFINCEVYQYGTIVQGDDNQIRIKPTETVNKTKVDFGSAKYSQDRGYIIKVKVLNMSTFKYEDKYINMYLSDFGGVVTFPKYIHFQRCDY